MKFMSALIVSIFATLPALACPTVNGAYFCGNAGNLNISTRITRTLFFYSINGEETPADGVTRESSVGRCDDDSVTITVSNPPDSFTSDECKSGAVARQTDFKITDISNSGANIKFQQINSVLCRDGKVAILDRHSDGCTRR